LIAFVGSVFSPYYALARRRGLADPDNHCALNVAIYGHNSKRWSMTERGRSQVTRTDRTFSVGPSALEWDGTALTIHINEIAVPLPRRLRGRIRVLPEFCLNQWLALDVRGRHHWTPLAPRCRVEVILQEPALRWSGEGYLDANTGVEPLEDAFSHWTWSRARTKDRTVVLYDVTERSGATRELALEISEAGMITEATVPPAVVLPSTLWGLSRTTRSHAPSKTAPRIIRTLEDSPFYARSSLLTHWHAKPAVAMHEALSLGRFRARLVQMMLPFRMPRRG
jgi:carotenoid 1,2-hydratase